MEIFTWLAETSPQLATFLLAMLPVTELRVSIPIALEVFHLPIWQAFIWSVLGDILPVLVIINFIGPISRWSRKRWRTADKFFTWLFARTRRKFDSSYATWGKIALMLFVAIPLPVTGAWTGSIAAWLFDVEKKEAIVYISLGVLIAATLVTLLTLGFISIFNL